MTNYVEGLGWLTERETRWWNDEIESLGPERGTSWQPCCYRSKAKRWDIQHEFGHNPEETPHVDDRWDTTATFAPLDIGVRVGWPIEGRERHPIWRWLVEHDDPTVL